MKGAAVSVFSASARAAHDNPIPAAAVVRRNRRRFIRLRQAEPGREYVVRCGDGRRGRREAFGVRPIHRRLADTVIGEIPRKAVLKHAHYYECCQVRTDRRSFTYVRVFIVSCRSVQVCPAFTPGVHWSRSSGGYGSAGSQPERRLEWDKRQAGRPRAARLASPLPVSLPRDKSIVRSTLVRTRLEAFSETFFRPRAGPVTQTAQTTIRRPSAEELTS